MGWPGHPRLAPSELDLDKSLRPWRRAAAVQRRSEERWIEIARFGSIAEARGAIDQEVGEGHGDLDDYRVVPMRRVSVAAALAVTLVSAFVAVVIVFWLLGR